MSTIVRLQPPQGPPVWVVRQDGVPDRVLPPLAELLALPLDEARAVVAAAREADPGSVAARVGTAGDQLLAPVDRQEVWAAGVTYRRSRDGRAEESVGAASLYDLVYEAERPEVFFKATAERVVPAGEPVGIRADSGWDVPEAEVGLVLTSRGEVFGYVPGDDVSSRSIEGENPLYLPQAKVYTRSCALGPGIVPAWEVPASGALGVSLRIERAGQVVYEESTSTAAMKRTFAELADWLLRALEFPHGAVLLTGTGLVPPAGFTLAAGDVGRVGVEGAGVLVNPVGVVCR